ncbi:MAG: hypothetical protein CSA61_00755 [Neptuniibacter caesariensis]|uniref:DUF3322 and DUF2220 domain-containing protein n=1 Tax=Neptuniibacter caesariensis TaxID=207954 RepID=A0A2G6JBC1_NEPCE|nr:MAG: hypothetical protein CSA61_00755 [Neptuniibacter caesariensis]
MTSNSASGRDSLQTRQTGKWGLLPADALQLLKVKYWQKPKKLKSLLSDGQSFPLVISLKPPRGNAAIRDIGHFQSFVASWKGFSQNPVQRLDQGSGQKEQASNNTGCVVRWEKRNFRSLVGQDIPTHLTIPDIESLARLLGPVEERQLQNWLEKIRYLFQSLLSQSSSPHINDHQASLQHNACDHHLFQALIDHLEALDRFEQGDLALLARLLPQLQKGMGQGCYLRALLVTFVDTKFIEQNLRIIESVVAALLDRNVKKTGLISWLDCKEKPRDWLLVKPLCEETRSRLGGLPLLRLSSDTLQEFELPASNILVIENEQSCLALQNVHDTIAVSGGGKNVAWMKAGWLADKNVGYWGDIDSEGLAILSDARSKLSSITPLMMDELTVKTFAERMVPEPDSVSKDPVALTETELVLFKGLRADHYAGRRLEQERLPMEYIAQHIDAWVV